MAYVHDPAAASESLASPAPKKSSDHHLTWRATALSAGVVVLAAIVGSASSYVTADRQIESQAAQAQADFLRQQRLTQYAQLVTAANTLNALTFPQFGGALSPSNPEDEQAAQDIYAAWETFEQHRDLVQLIAGNEVTAELEKLNSRLLSGVAGALASYCPGGAVNNVGDPPCDFPWEAVIPEDQVDNQYAGVIPDIVIAMRRELGVN
jgi:hypothetical protein